MEVEGGLLHAATSFDEHLHQLAATLQAPRARDERNVRFLTAFVRPRGLDAPATPAFVEEVERLMMLPRPAPALPGRLHAAAQPLVAWMARSADEGVLRPILRDTLEIANDRGQQHKAARRDERRTVKEWAVAAEQTQREKQLRTREQRKQIARIKGRIKALIGGVSR